MPPFNASNHLKVGAPDADNVNEPGPHLVAPLVLGAEGTGRIVKFNVLDTVHPEPGSVTVTV